MPFEEAVDELQETLGIQVSDSTVRRLTLEAAAICEQIQTEQAQMHRDACRFPLPKQEPASRMAMSGDGGMVPLRGGVWAEAKTVVIGHVQSKETPCKQRPAQHVETVTLSYFSRLTDAETFGSLATV